MRSRTLVHAFLLAALVLPSLACHVLFPKRSAGERLFRKHCADCHGLDAAGNTPRYMGNAWADLRDNEWREANGNPEALRAVIETGIFGEMEPFAGKLTSQEIDQVVHYLRFLRGEVAEGPVE